MKKILLIAAVMMSAVFTANAQARFEPGTFTLQPRIGGTGSMLTNAPKLNLGSLGIDKTLDAEPAGGAFIGLDMEYYVSKRFSVAAGVNYSNQGSGWEKFNVTNVAGSAEVKDLKIETSYINVPLTANYYVAKGLALKAGVQFGFLTDAKIKGTVKTSNTNMDYEETNKKEYNKFDVSIPVGLSYEFKTPITLDLRYNFGLTKVNKEETTTGKDSRNSVLTLTVGYKFKL